MQDTAKAEYITPVNPGHWLLLVGWFVFTPEQLAQYRVGLSAAGARRLRQTLILAAYLVVFLPLTLFGVTPILSISSDLRYEPWLSYWLPLLASLLGWLVAPLLGWLTGNSYLALVTTVPIATGLALTVSFTGIAPYLMLALVTLLLGLAVGLLGAAERHQAAQRVYVSAAQATAQIGRQRIRWWLGWVIVMLGGGLLLVWLGSQSDLSFLFAPPLSLAFWIAASGRHNGKPGDAWRIGGVVFLGTLLMSFLELTQPGSLSMFHYDNLFVKLQTVATFSLIAATVAGLVYALVFAIALSLAKWLLRRGSTVRNGLTTS